MSSCPGCTLVMPDNAMATYGGYFNTSPECWSVFGEVTAFQYAHPVVWGRAHQPFVDAYAVQHAGGPHPDKSVDVHLVGLYLVFERGFAPTDVPRDLQALAAGRTAWPHFPPPRKRGALTIFDVAVAQDPVAHIEAVEAWALAVWEAWADHHRAVAGFASPVLPE